MHSRTCWPGTWGRLSLAQHQPGRGVRAEAALGRAPANQVLGPGASIRSSSAAAVRPEIAQPHRAPNQLVRKATRMALDREDHRQRQQQRLIAVRRLNAWVLRPWRKDVESRIVQYTLRSCSGALRMLSAGPAVDPGADGTLVHQPMGSGSKGRSRDGPRLRDKILVLMADRWKSIGGYRCRSKGASLALATKPDRRDGIRLAMQRLSSRIHPCSASHRSLSSSWRPTPESAGMDGTSDTTAVDGLLDLLCE